MLVADSFISFPLQKVAFMAFYKRTNSTEHRANQNNHRNRYRMISIIKINQLAHPKIVECKCEKHAKNTEKRISDGMLGVLFVVVIAVATVIAVGTVVAGAVIVVIVIFGDRRTLKSLFE